MDNTNNNKCPNYLYGCPKVFADNENEFNRTTHFTNCKHKNPKTKKIGNYFQKINF